MSSNTVPPPYHDYTQVTTQERPPIHHVYEARPPSCRRTMDTMVFFRLTSSTIIGYCNVRNSDYVTADLTAVAPQAPLPRVE